MPQAHHLPRRRQRAHRRHPRTTGRAGAADVDGRSGSGEWHSLSCSEAVSACCSVGGADDLPARLAPAVRLSPRTVVCAVLSLVCSAPKRFDPPGYTRDMVLLATDEERAGAAMAALVKLACERRLPMTRAKVVKLLYLADLESMAVDGMAGSGILWRWLRSGPYCRLLRDVEDRLASDGVIECNTSHVAGAADEVTLSASRACDEMSSAAGGFVRHIDAVLRRHGRGSERALGEAVHGTAPMLEAQRGGERGVLLDLHGARPGVADVDAVTDLLAERPDLAVAPDIDPDDLGAPDADEIVGVFRGNRARANRTLLAR